MGIPEYTQSGGVALNKGMSMGFVDTNILPIGKILLDKRLVVCLDLSMGKVL